MPKAQKQHIVWFSWKDMANPAAGGAEVVTDQLLTRSVADGHEAVLICAGFKGSERVSNRNGYKIIRVGNKLTVYFAAWRYYRKNLKKWATLAIDECNTIPFYAGWYSGVRTIMFFHMLCRQIWFYQLPLPLSLIGWLTEPIYLRLLRRGQVVTVSESTKVDLIKSGFKSKDIEIISEGINLKGKKAVNPSAKYKYPTLLSLGSMRNMKRTLDQIKAFELVRKEIPNLKLIVAGDTSGSYGKRVLRTIEQSNYKDDIRVLGRVSSEKKKDVMEKSHLLLVTSIKEGWGLVVTEAASQGTPSIVYDVDGLRDSVKNGETGVISKANHQELANSIIELLGNKALYNQMCDKGLEFSKSITFEQCYSDFKKVTIV